MMAHTGNPSTWEAEERELLCWFKKSLSYIVNPRPPSAKKPDSHCKPKSKGLEKRKLEEVSASDTWLQQKVITVFISQT